jgi:hypothetical protein
MWFLLPLAFVLSACFGKGSDDSGAGAVSTATCDGTETRFECAQTIFQAKCISCHSNDHSAFGTYEEIDFAINAGPVSGERYVVAGSPATSLIYKKLKGSGIAGANMPQDSTLSTEDLADIYDWIANMPSSAPVISAGTDKTFKSLAGWNFSGERQS